MLLCTLLGLLSLFSLSHSQCSGGIPASEVKGFLDVHNKMRQSISAGTYVAKGKKMPAAKTPIPNLIWDCEIEKSAQAVASTCVFAHSKNRKNLGENLYTYMSSAVTGQGKAASDSWESEFKDYGWSDIKLTNAVFSSGVGHATQMAWAKSTKIGCGMATCNGGKQVIVACQYRDASVFFEEHFFESNNFLKQYVSVYIFRNFYFQNYRLFFQWKHAQRERLRAQIRCSTRMLLCTLLGLLSLFSLSHSQCSGGIPASEVKGFLDVHNKMRQSISAGTYVAKGRRCLRPRLPSRIW
ncbi:hypothetical protein PMAYCL1PPCAC_04577, partial [Pristionchus mayeri]